MVVRVLWGRPPGCFLGVGMCDYGGSGLLVVVGVVSTLVCPLLLGGAMSGKGHSCQCRG